VPLTADLPVPARTWSGGQTPAARSGDEATPARRDDEGGGLRAAWAVWATAVVVNVLIWGVVSLGAQDVVYFWPIWVAGPWGAVLLARTLFGRGQHG
jgi:hypothetical protein